MFNITRIQRIYSLLSHNTLIKTPVLIIDGDQITKNVELWKRCIPSTKMHYAVKANSDPLVLSLLDSLGCSFDVASEFEMELLHAIGVSGERMILSHPTKNDSTIESIARHRPWAIAADTYRELQKIIQCCKEVPGYSPVLFVRIRTYSKNVQDDLSIKFGCSDSEATVLLAQAKALGFEKFGLAFHVGTQCYDTENYLNAAERCQRIAEHAANHGVNVTWINFGGGMCDARTANQHGVDQEKFFTSLGEITKSLTGRFETIAEPGRFIVADAGTLVSKVISVFKRESGMHRIVIDDHVYGSLCGQKYDSRFFDLIPFRPDGRKPFSTDLIDCVVFGATCDSVDRIVGSQSETVSLPSDLDAGDFIAFECTGAYSTSSGSAFNGIEPAGVLMVHSVNNEIDLKESPLFRKSNMLINAVRNHAAHLSTKASHAAHLRRVSTFTETL